MSEAQDRPLAFITHAARARTQLAPPIDSIERRRVELGWRTRLPRRPRPGDGLPLGDRRRLRLGGYEEIERAGVVVHVPAGASLSGTRLHRELHHAVKSGVPILVMVL